MAPRKTLGNPQVSGSTLEEVRTSSTFWMQQIINYLDQTIGLRGTPTFHSDLDIGMNRLTRVATPQAPDDAVPVSEALTKSMDPEQRSRNWDAEGLRIFNLPFGENPLDAVNVEQLQRLIAEAIALALASIAAEPYVTALTSATLTAERVLTPEASVLTLTDAGANSTITVGIAANGVTDAKLRQGVATSVIGRSANSTGNVADIAASADAQVLRRLAGVLGFGFITTASVSDYSEGSFTATGTGFTVNPTGTAYYIKIGKQVTLYIPLLTGTSNANTFTITGMPIDIRPTLDQITQVSGLDNTVALPFTSLLVANVTTITLIPGFGVAANTWTAAGTKRCLYHTLSYVLL